MVVALVILMCVCGGLLVQYLRCILAVRDLCLQTEELDEGSYMELGVTSRQKDLLLLCQRLNQLQQTNFRRQRLYENSEKQLKQNITGLAHDIRTPLTGAAGYLQLARECQEKERQEHYLETAEDRLGELGDMLEELFLYTKLSSAEYQLNLGEIQVLPLLSDCLLGFYRQFEERGISPEVQFESECIWFLADEEALRRIFHNLIQNALLHGGGGIIIRQKDCCLIFENPIAEGSRPDPEQIFERFYKADQARRKGSSGLGLFIVKELAERMGGSVRAQLEGAWLRIELKLVTPP